MLKEEARKIGQKNRALLSKEERKLKSHHICLQAIRYIHDKNIIGIYMPIKEEVDTIEIIKYCFSHHKIVCIPKVIGNTLSFYPISSFSDVKEGTFHVLEPTTNMPISIEDIDILFVPLSSYDKYGNRCGYGKGYYDSILKRSSCKIGLAFSEQEVNKIEIEEHDVPLDKVISF